MKTIAPICLFVYNRPWHTMQTIEALKKNNLAIESELYIFSDGPKNDGATEAVASVRSYIQTINNFKNKHIILRERNFGLAKNIISGVSQVVKSSGKVIVLEDDLLTNPYFLQYMNDALELYKNEEDVISVHGYVYPIQNLPKTFFLKGADCWGWATWDRAWDIFEPNGAKLLNEIKQRKLEKEIDFNYTANYMKMLKDQIIGKNDSWAIRWHLSAFLRNKLTLYPGESFVKNIGCDDSGQHSIASKVFDPIMCDKYVELKKIQIIANEDAYKKFETYFKKTKKNILKKAYNHFIKKSLVHSSIKASFKRIIKDIMPPLLYFFVINNKFLKRGWHGNYQSWDEAKLGSSGYDAEEILNKVHESLYKVKVGISKYERDSVLFDKIDYSWPLLTGLMLVAAKFNGKIHVLDFGGSLGSTFFQNKKILDHFDDVKWSIVEQQHFVKVGKNDFEDERLKFYLTVEDCLKVQSPNILILSSVIQYLEKPYEFLKNLIAQTNVDYIIIDRTPFIESDDRIVIQTVPASIYKASYPCHIFNFLKFKSFFLLNGYSLIEEFEALDGKKKDINFKGLIYVREKV